MRLRRSTKVLLPLLAIVLVLWTLSWFRFTVFSVTFAGRFAMIAQADGFMALIFSFGSHRNPAAVDFMWREIPDDIHPGSDDLLPGFDFRLNAFSLRAHIHHWLLTTIIALLLIILHLRHRYRRQPAEPLTPATSLES